MGDQTKIEWADSTLNYWIGCTQLKRKGGGSACDDCYAMRMAPRLRMGVKWNGPPVRGRDAWWTKAAAYQRGADRFFRKHGRRRRIFVNSMSDFFDKLANPAWRAEACVQMEAAPDVVFLLLTKRPENVIRMVPAHWLKPGGWPENVWLGTTVEAQDTADHRIPLLLAVPGPRVRFLSMEPLLERVTLRVEWLAQLQWVIIGGESGRKARPTLISWVRSLVSQCEAARIPVLFKQWGEWCPAGQYDGPVRTDGNYPVSHVRGEVTMFRIGKKLAGRRLDGSLYTEFPPDRLAA